MSIINKVFDRGGLALFWLDIILALENSKKAFHCDLGRKRAFTIAFVHMLRVMLFKDDEQRPYWLKIASSFNLRRG